MSRHGIKTWLAAGSLAALAGISGFAWNELWKSDASREFAGCESHAYDPAHFEDSERFRCYAKVIGLQMQQSGLESTLAAFQDYLSTETGKILVGGSCHALGHYIGEAAVSSGFSASEILERCVNTCGNSEAAKVPIGQNYGCLNGAAHIHVLSKRNVSSAEEFCNAGSVPKDVRLGCYHGIGHGVSELTGLDVATGLELCSKLTSEDGRYQCGHAVLMEPRLAALAPIHSIPDQVSAFCAGLASAYRDSCYEFSGYLAYADSADSKKAIASCDEVPQRFREGCAERIGEAFFMAFGRNGPAAVASACTFGGSPAVSRSCLKGANRIAMSGPDNAGGDFGRSVCEAVSPALKDPCIKDFEMLR